MGFNIYTYALMFYFLGLGGGLIASKSGSRLRGWPTMIVSAALFAVLWRSAQPGVIYASYVMFLAGVLFLTLTFLIGFGLFIGSLIARLRLKPVIRRLAVVLAIAAPVTLMLVHVDKVEKRRAAQELADQKDLAAWQSQTLKGELGEHTVTFPVQPNLQISHSCRDHKSTCVSSWGRAGLNMAEADDLVLQSLRFSIRPQRAKTLVNWCTSNFPAFDNAWCELHPDYDFSFEAEGFRRVPLEEAGNVILYPAPQRVKVLACYRKSQIERCRVEFEVAHGVRARVFSSGLSPEAAAERALELLPTIKRRWRALTDLE
ncbi:MAG: hypothetical protein AAGF27_01585 [Pseudomonadota bacterium]